MKVLVDENQNSNADIHNHNKNIGGKEQEKDRVHEVLRDLKPFYLEGEAVVGVVFHEAEIIK